ncbi:MAG: TIGR02300 family protein [Alphaproteobacteria bacterium]|nr:TIGR02300 family protein [Alphaproteobacteria bacterium]MDE2341549.1 TIGR02300 family protein [Alphaproteobacteria bacterium]
MANAEWGTKRACPKCGTRFYDLGNDDPVTCISCGNTWVPEPVLKSKQPLPYEEAKSSQNAPAAADADLHEDIDIDADEGEPSPDDEVDLGGDDDLGVDMGDEGEEH